MSPSQGRLQRHLEVVGHVDRRLAAFTEHALDLVAAFEVSALLLLAWLGSLVMMSAVVW